MNDSKALEILGKKSSWYGELARYNHSRYVVLKTMPIIFAAAIPVVSVGSGGDSQRWASAVLGALIGIIGGIIQLGQYQQNWLLYRATREALNREELLHSAKAGPYSDAADPDTRFVERSDAIISGENSIWLSSQQQAIVAKHSARTDGGATT